MYADDVVINAERPGSSWLALPTRRISGSIGTLMPELPTFERRPFSVATRGGAESANSRLDVIVRKPTLTEAFDMPVGVVSKDYQLVQHTRAMEVIGDALNRCGIDAPAMKADLVLTDHGERMALSIFLPDEFAFDAGDGHPMALRVECFNSVDGSSRFRVLLGWFRFICSNGMTVGVTPLQFPFPPRRTRRR